MIKSPIESLDFDRGSIEISTQDGKVILSNEIQRDQADHIAKFRKRIQDEDEFMTAHKSLLFVV